MKKILEELYIPLFLTVIGGLLGYGLEGTFQSACMGAGIGGALVPTLLILAAFFQ